LRRYTGLHRAAARGDAAEILRLIAQGANPDATESNRRTPLHVAAFASKPEAIRALVKGGANPNTLDAQRYDIVTILAVFPILINTIAGVRNVPPQLIELGNAFAANEREIFTKIILPSALPYMMTGLRLGIGRAIIGMVVAEFFTAITGLGALIVKYGNQYDTATMFVPILVLMVLGVTLSIAVRRAEQWIAPWRYTEE
jgi:hypothetical protein